VAKLNSRGFTLLELLVVLVIAAIITAMISMAVASSPGRDLRFEAERLSQLLALAREEAQVRGKAIRFESTVEAYRFLSLLDREWQPIPNEPDLRERRWEQPTRVTLQRRDDRSYIEFGRDSVDSPFKLNLSRDGAQVVIQANGLGGFVVE
jgi:general secretion pathway protein H